MAIADDWTITYGATKTVEHTSGTTVYTVLEFFQWLAAEFAASAQMDDDYAFVSDTPTVYRWVNDWDFGAPSTDYKFLKGGSVESSDADELYANLYSIGSQEDGTDLYVIQNDAELTPWWTSGNIDILILVKTGGALIDSGDVLVMARETDYDYDHNYVALAGGGRNVVGINNANDLAFDDTGDIYLAVDDVTDFNVGNYVEGVSSGATARISYVDSTNDYLYVCMVEDGPFTNSETIQESLTRGGASTGTTATGEATIQFEVVSSYTDVVPLFIQREFTGGTVVSGPFTLGETITQTGSGATGKYIYVDDSDVLYIEETSGTFNGTGLLSGASASYTPTGTSVQTELDLDMNNGAGVQPYNCFVDCGGRSVTQVYQSLKYQTAHNSSFTLNGDEGEEYISCVPATYTAVKKAPFGTLAGGTFFGARGVWLHDYLAANFSLIDANNLVQNPPNYQKVSAAHTNLSGCQVFVAEITAQSGDIIKDQYTYDDGSSDATHLYVNEVIDINKTPQSGTLRVGDTIYTYTSFNSTSKYFIVTSDPTGEIDNSDVYVPLMDRTADETPELSDNIIYDSPFWCRTVVRKYGYKPYTQDVQFGATGITFSPILTDDPQAT